MSIVVPIRRADYYLYLSQVLLVSLQKMISDRMVREGCMLRGVYMDAKELAAMLRRVAINFSSSGHFGQSEQDEYDRRLVGQIMRVIPSLRPYSLKVVEGDLLDMAEFIETMDSSRFLNRPEISAAIQLRRFLEELVRIGESLVSAEVLGGGTSLDEMEKT